MAHYFSSFLLLFLIGHHFQNLDSFKLESGEQASDDVVVGDGILVPRQEDDYEDDDDRKQVVGGIGNILTGAFSLNLNKILKGAFSFADEDVQNNILNKLFFRIPQSTTLRSVSNKTKIDPNNTAATRRRRSTTPPSVASVKPTVLPVSPSVETEDEDEDLS